MLLIISVGIACAVAVAMADKRRRKRNAAIKRLVESAAPRKSAETSYELYNVDRLLQNRSERWD